MKHPKKIKIIDSCPDEGQFGIQSLIGMVFPVVIFDKENGTVSVSSEKYKGTIILHPSEFQVVE